MVIPPKFSLSFLHLQIFLSLERNGRWGEGFLFSDITRESLSELSVCYVDMKLIDILFFLVESEREYSLITLFSLLNEM